MPTIVYVSRTHQAERIAASLSEDGIPARPYHGKMDVTEKQANQDGFIRGDFSVIVATSAFGMGVDKPDVQLVIHFDISDSLENYMQEAGRAGRDQHLSAMCYILFTEEDLDKHFILLNQTKVDVKQVQQVWKAIKEMTKFRTTLSQSALDIARQAGWTEQAQGVEARVKTAIAALEEAGYVRRGQNQVSIYADSIQTRTAQEAIDRIGQADIFTEKQKVRAQRLIKALIGAKHRKSSSDEAAESRIDYLADILGMPQGEVIEIVGLLRQSGILADQRDIQAFLKANGKRAALDMLDVFIRLEHFLLTCFGETEDIFDLKLLNERAEKDISGVSVKKITQLLIC
ncbi:MAG: hypothetical protein OHK0039_33630 [Bacteroidia bacterium]